MDELISLRTGKSGWEMGRLRLISRPSEDELLQDVLLRFELPDELHELLVKFCSATCGLTLSTFEE